MKLLRKIVAGVVIAGVVATAVVVGWQTVVLSPYQQLKTQYFMSVCDIQPMWFNRHYSEQTVTELLQAELEDTATAMRREGADPAGAQDLVSYLLNVAPTSVLWHNASYTISGAVSADLLNEGLAPTMDEAAAEAKGAELHHASWNTLDPWVLSFRDECPGTVFGRTFSDG